MTAAAATLERVIVASDRWISDYEEALLPSASRYADALSRRATPVREAAHRFAGLDVRQSMEHALRLARTVRNKAEELAAKPNPHPMDLHMVRAMACRLCKLNRDHPCDPESADAAECCELSLY